MHVLAALGAQSTSTGSAPYPADMRRASSARSPGLARWVAARRACWTLALTPDGLVAVEPPPVPPDRAAPGSRSRSTTSRPTAPNPSAQPAGPAPRGQPAEWSGCSAAPQRDLRRARGGGRAPLEAERLRGLDLGILVVDLWEVGGVDLLDLGHAGLQVVLVIFVGLGVAHAERGHPGRDHREGGGCGPPAPGPARGAGLGLEPTRGEALAQDRGGEWPPPPSMSRLGRMRSSHLGSHQLAWPISFIVAGTSTQADDRGVEEDRRRRGRRPSS